MKQINHLEGEYSNLGTSRPNQILSPFIPAFCIW